MPDHKRLNTEDGRGQKKMKQLPTLDSLICFEWIETVFTCVIRFDMFWQSSRKIFAKHWLFYFQTGPADNLVPQVFLVVLIIIRVGVFAFYHRNDV